MTYTNLSLQRSASSGISVSNEQDVRDYLDAIKADMVLASIAAAVPTHHTGRLTNDVANVPAIPGDVADCIAFVNTMKTEMEAHLSSASVHAAASAETIAAAAADSQGTADSLAAELVADYNTHLTEAGVHVANDAVNIAVDSTDGNPAPLIATCTSLREKFLAHVVITMNAGIIS